MHAALRSHVHGLVLPLLDLVGLSSVLDSELRPHGLQQLGRGGLRPAAVGGQPSRVRLQRHEMLVAIVASPPPVLAAQIDPYRTWRLPRAGDERTEAGKQRLQRVERDELVLLELRRGEAREERQQQQRPLEVERGVEHRAGVQQINEKREVVEARQLLHHRLDVARCPVPPQHAQRRQPALQARCLRKGW